MEITYAVRHFIRCCFLLNSIYYFYGYLGGNIFWHKTGLDLSTKILMLCHNDRGQKRIVINVKHYEE